MVKTQHSDIPADCQQAVIVIIDHQNVISAMLFVAEKIRNTWRTALQRVPAVIGKKGFGKEREGDLKAPAGLYHISRAFGWGYTLNEPKLPWELIDENDVWIDDPTSVYYNQQIHAEDSPCQFGKSFERLMIPQYKYSIVFDYNQENIPEKGSAIFLHVWKNANIGTAGCTAVSEAAMFHLLHWLDATKHPIIIQETREHIQEHYPELGVLPDIFIHKTPKGTI